MKTSNLQIQNKHFYIHNVGGARRLKPITPYKACLSVCPNAPDKKQLRSRCRVISGTHKLGRNKCYQLPKMRQRKYGGSYVGGRKLTAKQLSARLSANRMKRKQRCDDLYRESKNECNSMGGTGVGGAYSGGMYVGGKRKKKVKNPWISYVKKFRKMHPNLSYQDALVAAAGKYRGGCDDCY